MSGKILLWQIVVFLCPSSIVLARSLVFVTLVSPPAEFLDEGRPAGRNVEIVQEACRRTGFDCTIDFVPWQRALYMVENGLADGIIDAAFTQERSRYLYYPEEPIYVEEWYGFKRVDSELTLDENLANAGEIRLGASYGFIYGGLIQDAIQKGLFKGIETVSNNEMNIKKLIAGRFDMFTGVKLTILSLAEKMGYADKIAIVKKTGTEQAFLLSSSPTYLGFSRKTISRDIVDQFSRAFTALKEDGAAERVDTGF